MKNKSDEATRLAFELLKESQNSAPIDSHEFQYYRHLPLPKFCDCTKELKKAVIVPQTKGCFSFEQKHCVPNQNYPLIFLEALKKRRLSTNAFKERWIAIRSLKQLSYEMQQWVYVQLKDRVQTANDKSASDFSQLIKTREERHFQIDRGIKYLADF